MAITPYLYYEDVDRVLKFLAKPFGLRKCGVQVRGTDGKINHAAMKLGDALIMMGRQLRAQNGVHNGWRGSPRVPSGAD